MAEKEADMNQTVNTPQGGHENAKPASAQKEAAGPGRAAKVLLIEHNSVDRQMAMNLLTMVGTSVVEVEKGEVALRVLEPSRREPIYDLILVALQMPGMDGFETVQRIRGHRIYERVPVIAMTGRVDGSERDRCLADGMSGYIGKPLESDTFYALLTECLPGLFPSGVSAGDTCRLPLLTARDGFNLETGFVTFGGKPEHYLKFLWMFTEHYQDGLPADAANPDKVARVAAMLKSQAECLGHRMLVEAATAVEDRCGAGADVSDELKAALDYLELVLSSVTATVQEALEESRRNRSASQPGAGEDEDAARLALLQRLKGEIENFEAEALATLGSLSAWLAQQEPGDAAALEAALQKYEFEEALELIVRFMEKA